MEIDLAILKEEIKTSSVKELSVKYGCSLSNISYYVRKIKKELPETTDREFIEKYCLAADGTLKAKLPKLVFNRFDLKNDIPRFMYHLYHNIENSPSCLECNNDSIFKGFTEGYGEYCSFECGVRSEKRNLKIKSKLDYSIVHQKAKASMVDKYGENYFNSEQFKELSKKTKLEKYGDEFYCNRNLAEETKKKKYGQSNFFLTDEFKKKSLETRLARYGCYNPSPLFGCVSKAEISLLNFLKDNGFEDFKKNRTLLKTLELDAYSEKYKIAFEYCGIYWHSERFLDKNYHFNKMKRCNENGVNLITIFDDEWNNKNSQVKSYILSKLGKYDRILYARQCSLSIETNNDFLQENHIQGNSNNQAIVIVLRYINDIVGMMTFGKHHRDNKTMVLKRMAFRSGTLVVGGASRMLKYSLDYLKTNKIVSWSDNRWSQGDIYKTLGFELTKELPPDYSYIYNNKRIPKQAMQKKKIDCPENMTEHEFCLSNGLYRIYDCGKKQWTLRI